MGQMELGSPGFERGGGRAAKEKMTQGQRKSLKRLNPAKPIQVFPLIYLDWPCPDFAGFG
jgi:hypothetical protein